MVTALTAVVVGVGAIGVSMYETLLIRQQLKGSAWPHLEIGYSATPERFVYLLTNTGVGPARIRHAEVTVDDELASDWPTVFRRLALEVDLNTMSRSFISTRGAMPPGDGMVVLELGNAQPLEGMLQQMGRVDIAVCYCSVYDDCWVAALRQEPSPARACPNDEARRFRN